MNLAGHTQEADSLMNAKENITIIIMAPGEAGTKASQIMLQEPSTS